MSTSKLQNAVARFIINECGVLNFKENHRPEWLISERGERLELDFYIEDARLGIEVQGMQHYQYVPHFHLSPDGFEAQKRRDADKRLLCAQAGIDIIEINGTSDFPLLLARCGDMKAMRLQVLESFNAEMDEIMRHLLKTKPRVVYKIRSKAKRIQKYTKLMINAEDAASRTSAFWEAEITRRSLIQCLRDNGHWLERSRSTLYSPVVVQTWE